MKVQCEFENVSIFGERWKNKVKCDTFYSFEKICTEKMCMAEII